MTTDETKQLSEEAFIAIALASGFTKIGGTVCIFCAHVIMPFKLEATRAHYLACPNNPLRPLAVHGPASGGVSGEQVAPGPYCDHAHLDSEVKRLRKEVEYHRAGAQQNRAERDAAQSELEKLRTENTELRVIAGSDPTTATRDDLRRWTARQHDEIRNLKARIAELEGALRGAVEAFGDLDRRCDPMKAYGVITAALTPATPEAPKCVCFYKEDCTCQPQAKPLSRTQARTLALQQAKPAEPAKCEHGRPLREPCILCGERESDCAKPAEPAQCATCDVPMAAHDASMSRACELTQRRQAPSPRLEVAPDQVCGHGHPTSACTSCAPTYDDIQAQLIGALEALRITKENRDDYVQKYRDARARLADAVKLLGRWLSGDEPATATRALIDGQKPEGA